MSVSGEAVLRVEDLTVRYDSVPAVTQATFEVGGGEIVAIVGPNGAGKSSLLTAIAAMTPKAGGRIEICGRSTDDVPRSEIVRLGAALVPEGRQIFTSLSVLENLRLGATTRRDAEIASDLEAMFAEFPVLAERRRQTAGLLSGGEQQMLAIARALMSRPRLLMLDEPSLGLAPMAIARVYDRLTAIRSRGVAVLVAEQNATRAFAVADRALIMSHGRFSLSGRPDEIRTHRDFDGAYFGVAMSGASWSR
jgi:branched-chain amino acid transport system ATP-binding protein